MTKQNKNVILEKMWFLMNKPCVRGTCRYDGIG
jgi:hypothetical protein